MDRIYYYKLTVDDGGAPCVQDELLSLAICKPFIRMSADRGATIFGFAANSLDPSNRLLYVAVVTDKRCHGLYYEEVEFAGRSDCIYARRGNRLVRRTGARYHTESDLVHDLGAHPKYPRAQVLLSKDFRYLGDRGTSRYKEDYAAIKAAVEGLGRGHRVNHSARLREELLKLKQLVWKSTTRMRVGQPLMTASRGHCHRERACGIVEGSRS